MNNNYRAFVVDAIKAAGQELIDRADTMISSDMNLIGNVKITVSIDQDCYPYLIIGIETPITNAKTLYNKHLTK